jgi:hypothetical protein
VRGVQQPGVVGAPSTWPRSGSGSEIRHLIQVTCLRAIAAPPDVLDGVRVMNGPAGVELTGGRG